VNARSLVMRLTDIIEAIERVRARVCALSPCGRGHERRLQQTLPGEG
jgi:hypothetical protein